MKSALFALALIGIQALASHAMASGRILHVSRHSGYVPPQYTYAVECDFYETQLVRRWMIGGTGNWQGESKAIRFIDFVANASAAQSLIQQAAQGQLLKTDGPTDGPSLVVTGIIEGDVVDQHVKILRDYSDTVFTNSAHGTNALIDLAVKNCEAPVIR